MTIADLNLPISSQAAQAYALVFSDALAARLAEVWAKHGTPNAVPNPRRLTDGRWMLCADILTEIQPGGLLHAMWANVDQAVVLASVDVVPIAEAVTLLPVEVPLQIAPANTLPTGSTTINGTLGGRLFGR